MGAAQHPIRAEITTQGEVARALSVLVVDDSRAQCVLLAALLRRAGHRVEIAMSGEAALEHCRREPVDLILSDWMMPGMSGPEFCRAFRALDRDSYGYFILLTSKSDREDIAAGLDAGADDFLVKPVNQSELRARIAAGQRIIEMERQLHEKNRLLGATLGELQAVYESIDHDLQEARKLQQSLVAERFRDFGAGQVSLLLRSSGHVGGDLVGFFAGGRSEIGVYSIDVSGHGITSALMGARLAGSLSAGTPDQNLALSATDAGDYRMLPPGEVVARLNQLMLEEMRTDHYCTIALAFIDLQTGKVRMTQAGHPHPAIQRRDGRVEFVGDGGLPVGLLPDADYDEFALQLDPGDRLLLCSDGITECPDPDGALLEEGGLAASLGRNRAVRGPALLEALVWDLTGFHQGEEFPDDVSAALFEFAGNAATDARA